MDQKGGQIPWNSLNQLVYWDWVNSLQKGFSYLTRVLTLSSLCDFQTFFFFFSSRTHFLGKKLSLKAQYIKKTKLFFNWHNAVYKFKFVIFTLIYVCVLSHSVVSDSLWSHDGILPGSSVNEDSPGKKARVGCHALLQGIFPTQGSNPGLLHCRQILYHLSHQGSPFTNINQLIRIMRMFWWTPKF